jgi:pimeloyl-ACP methyl ester carboxylesterase
MQNNINFTCYANPYKSKEEYDRDLNEIKVITEINKSRSGISDLQPVKKEKNRSILNKKQRLECSDGWWLNYTDNKDCFEIFQTDYVLLTVHGLPGTPEDFYYLEKELNGYCRILGYSIPGFDKETEIRGNYRGSRTDNADLILRLLDHLKIDKIFVVMHSGGGSVGSKFVELYPKKIQGVLKLTTFGRTYSIGFKTYHTMCVTYSGVFEEGEQVLYDPVRRKQFLKEFNELAAQIRFDDLPMMLFDEFSLHAFAKLGGTIKYEVTFWFNIYILMLNHFYQCLLIIK